MLRTVYSKATPSGVVFPEPFFWRSFVGENVKMVAVANLFARVDVNPDGRHRFASTGKVDRLG
jgi:hypothetical protein